MNREYIRFLPHSRPPDESINEHKVTWCQWSLLSSSRLMRAHNPFESFGHQMVEIQPGQVVIAATDLYMCLEGDTYYPSVKILVDGYELPLDIGGFQIYDFNEIHRTEGKKLKSLNPTVDRKKIVQLLIDYADCLNKDIDTKHHIVKLALNIESLDFDTE